jgi:regulation of enolase protein 1 (concanavalin A-like superfamily)
MRSFIFKQTYVTMKHVYFFRKVSLWGLVLIFIAGFGHFSLQAQCNYLGNQYLSSPAPTSPGVQTELTTCLFAGEYREVTNLIAGNTYRFETCGDTDFDSQITIFPSGGGAALAFNDDFCGVQSSVDFTPAVTGNYDVQINEFDCTTNTLCMTLKVTLLGAPCTENEVVINMFDAFGDGWNGNNLTILNENNSVVGTATINDGGSGAKSFCLPDGCYTVDVGGGSFASEVSWDISVNGSPALSGGAPESGLELAVNSTCGTPPVSCNDNALELDLSFDTFSSETSWEITDANGFEVAAGGNYSGLGNTNLTEDICLPDGCYELTVFDSFDDGMCCSFGAGGYSLQDAENNILASGGEFGSSETTEFCLGIEPCDIAINSSSSSPETCPGDNDGAISVSASCTSCEGLAYSIGGAFQGSNTFSGLSAGTYTVTVRDPNNLSCSASTTISVGNGTGGTVLPPWSASDIGSPAGNAFAQNPCNGSGLFTVTNGGSNGYSNAADNTAMIHQTICGNGSITVKIESVSGSGFGGVVLRESTAPGAKQAMILTNLNSLVPWVTRNANNAPNNFTPHWRAHTFWLKLERIGNYIRGYASTTGNSFSLVAQTYLPMEACVEIGMITANTGGGQTTATFSNVTVEGGAPLLAADETAIAAETDREKSAASAGVRGFDQPAATEAARLFPNPASDRITIDLPATQPMDATLVLRN